MADHHTQPRTTPTFTNAIVLPVAYPLDRLTISGFYTITDPPGLDAGDYFLICFAGVDGTVTRSVFQTAHKMSGVATYTRALTVSGWTAWTETGGAGSTVMEVTHNVSTVTVGLQGGTPADINAATHTVAGVMSAADKTKLDGIEAGAEVNIATDLSITNNTASTMDVLSSTGSDITLPAATNSLAGLMSAADKAKLDAYPSFADNAFELSDNVDPTKKLKLELSGLTTATTRTITIPDASFTMVGLDTTQTLTNKTIGITNTITAKDSTFTIADDGDATKKIAFQASALTTGTTRTITMIDADMTLVGLTNAQSLTNKTFDNSNTFTIRDDRLTLQDNADATKQVVFELSGITTGTTRTITLPNANTTLVGVGNTATLQNKTLDNTNTITVKDNNFTIQDDVDTTKQAVFQASGITTATTRTVTLQDASGTMAFISDVNSAASPFANLGLTVSVASNAMTIAVKTQAGNNASAASPVYIGFPNTSTSQALVSGISVTAALSITVPSGTTIGTVSAVPSPRYIYAINNSGTVELAISCKHFGTSGTVSTTAVSGGATSTTMYSTTARSSVPFVLLGMIYGSQTTAGTWASLPSTVQLAPVTLKSYQFRLDRNGVAQTGWATATFTKCNVTRALYDTDGVFESGNNRARIQEPGKYHVMAALCPNSNITATGYIYQNGSSASVNMSYLTLTGNLGTSFGATWVDCVVGDYIELYGYQASGSTDAMYGVAAYTWIAGAISR